MKVAVECNADEAVMRTLGVPRKQIFHQANKGEVIKWLKKNADAVGMVDEDPDSSQPCDLSNYQEICSAEGLRLRIRSGNNNQRLVIVCPRLEEWFYNRAGLSSIIPQDYGLPGDPDNLHRIPRYEQKDGFARFLADLKARDKGMKLLHQWIFENTT
jgi:hypothetical protein